MNRHVSKILAFLTMFALAGCADKIRPGALPMPERYLTCADEPAMPDKPAPEDRESVIARYMLDLRAAGQDCRTKLGQVRTYVREAK